MTEEVAASPGLRFLKLSHKEGKGSPCYGFVAQFIEAVRGLRSTFLLCEASVSSQGLCLEMMNKPFSFL